MIDFSGICVGDPACDLVIAWNSFTTMARQIFKDNMSLDVDTWNRARGWALWKAMITLASLEDKTSLEAIKQLQIINEVVND